MASALIRLGDTTSHGGVVIEASGKSFTGNVSIARMGDKVTCPIPGHGTNPIVSGDPTFIVDGQPVAREGDKTACGATLIPSQLVTTVSNGSASSGSPKVAERPTTDNQRAEVKKPESLEDQYDEQAHLIEPSISGVPFYAETMDGRTFSGRADPDGQLPRIDTFGEDAYTVLWGDAALAKSASE